MERDGDVVNSVRDWSTFDTSALPHWNVDDYIREEVRRQGHNLDDPNDGGLRVKWMMSAWRYALTVKHTFRDLLLDLDDIENIGRLVEREKNANGLRTCHVRVGTRLCPPPDQVRDMVARLVEHGNKLSPLEFYYELMLIHPFLDGNGRTGKIVLAWRADSLSNPFFPPSDLFGYPILNP